MENQVVFGSGYLFGIPRFLDFSEFHKICMENQVVFGSGYLFRIPRFLDFSDFHKICMENQVVFGSGYLAREIQNLYGNPYERMWNSKKILNTVM